MLTDPVRMALRHLGNATRGVIGLLSCALAGLLILSQSAAAAPVQIIYSLQNDVGAGLISGATNSDSLAAITLAGTNAFGFGTTTVVANHGTLGASAEVVGRGLIASGIQFQDTLTIVSNTLAVGTPIDLRVSFTLDYELSAGCAGAVSEASIDAVLVLGGNVLQYQDHACAGVGIDNTSGVMQFFVGDEITLNPQLIIIAAAGNCCESGHARANALHTMSFFVDPLSSDFTYTSATGSIYLTPAAVSEPTTLLLFSASLVGVAAIRRRKWKALRAGPSEVERAH